MTPTENTEMDLLLWRHADAEDVAQDKNDLDRKLTARGHGQAETMGRWLRKRLPSDAVVLVSPARRCLETARGLGRPFRTESAVGPEHGWESLLKAAQWPNSPRPVLIIGHQPALGELAAQLMCGMDLPWSIRKGSVCWLRYRVRETVADVQLRAVISPDLLGH